MEYQKAKEIVEKYGQEHILQSYEQLTKQQQEILLEQIANADFSVTRMAKCGKDVAKKGKIAPLAAMQIDTIEQYKEEFKKTGLDALKKHKLGAVLLAGGMGTRLGSDNPKGMYDIGVTKELYIFECLINNLLDVVKEVGEWIPLFIMTSDKNDRATTTFLEEKDYFGYNKEYITFFKQDMAPATDYSGKVYMENPYTIAMSPNGNGGWFSSMLRSNTIKIVEDYGIEWLNVFAVDNVLQKIADPIFLGATMQSKCSVGAKVVRKVDKREKVGVVCLEDGKPSIVEYYELTEELMDEKDAKGDPAYNFGVILNYLFNLNNLKEIVKKELPLHIVEKKISYMDETGEMRKPEKENGYKYESLILDMIHLADGCLPFEVDRNKEFAPIKNKEGVDSVESARVLLTQNGVTL